MQGFALNNISDCYVGSNQASAIYLGSTLIWPTTPPPHDYSHDYFTIEALGPGILSCYISNSIYYSLDNGNTWRTLSSSGDIHLNTGDKVLFKNNLINHYLSDVYSTCNINVYGNIMSLIYGDNFVGQSIIFARYQFANMFNINTNLKNASNLILPATTLTESCYKGMFSGCTSLITAPELPATILVDSCYEEMFKGCTNLSYIKCLATDISATNCTYNWVNNVSSTGTFVKNASMTNWTTGISGIPSGWTVQNA